MRTSSLLAGLARALLYMLLGAPLLAFALHALSTRWFYPQLLPTRWDAGPLAERLFDPRTLAALGLSLELGALVSLLALLVGLPAAYTLGTQTFRGRSAVLLLLFLPTVVPPVALGIGLNALALRLGLAGTLAGVALAHLIPTLPYVVFTLAGVFARYDRNYERQALVLGAGPLRIWWSVTLPLVLPGLAVAALFAFLISWSQYILTLLIGGGQLITLPVLLFSAASGGNPASIAALALLAVAPPALMIALASRYLGGPATATQL